MFEFSSDQTRSETPANDGAAKMSAEKLDWHTEDLVSAIQRATSRRRVPKSGSFLESREESVLTILDMTRFCHKKECHQLRQIESHTLK